LWSFWTLDCLVFFQFKFVNNLSSWFVWEFIDVKNQVLYYLAFPNDWLYMKCLVYGIYILEVVPSALITQFVFWTLVTRLGDVQVFNRIETWVSVPILNTIGELSHTEHEWLMSNTPPRYILCSRILCASDPHFGMIEESGRCNFWCKWLKEVYCI